MAGHGRPTPIDEYAERVGRFRPAMLSSVAFLVWVLGGSLSAEAAAGVDLALRFRLICDVPLEVEGEIVASRGHFETPENLSMDAGTTGGFWLRPDRQSIRVQPRGSSDRLGLQSRYIGEVDDVLRLRLRMHDPAAPQVPGTAGEQTVEVPLPIEDLIDGSFDQMIAGGVRLWVARVPGDSLRVRLGTSGAMVFSASETVPLEIMLNAIAAPGSRPLELQMKLQRDGDKSKAPLWQRTIAIVSDDAKTLTSSPAAVEIDGGSIELPDREGVYTLLTRLVPSTGSSFVDRLARPEIFAAEPIAQRSVQFVIVEPLPPPVDPTPMAEIARLRPLDRNWLGVGSTNADSGEPLVRGAYAGRDVVVLAAGDWMAQPIPVRELGKPHVVVVRYPADQPLKIGISIREPNAAGDSSPLGIDSGVVHEPDVAAFDFSSAASRASATGTSPADQTAAGRTTAAPASTYPTSSGPSAGSRSPDDRATTGQATNGQATAVRLTSETGSGGLWGEHRVVFWPRHRQPVVIVSNADPHQSVRIESIAVEAGPARLAGGLTSSRDGRMAAIYLDKPLMTDAFGCEGAVDADGAVVLQDWNTFLQAGQRLVDYVQASGGNAAVMTIIGEGGSLYPTEVFAATPRYDTGTFFSDGRDPVRKDVLELMLRLFDRSGLRLIAGVELATPLPQLEAALEDPATAVGLQWSDAMGRQYVERRPPRHGLAPYYNVLDPRTEQQVSAVVQEIRSRYAHHRSFAGLGLHLGPQTYLQLPSTLWGRDAKTIARLRGDWSSGDTPNSPPPDTAIHAWLDGEAASWFSAWRKRQMGELFERLAAQTAGRPLLLLTADFLPPASGGEADDCGLDWQDLAARPGVVPMRLLREQLLVEPARRIDDAKMLEDLGWDRLLSEASRRPPNGPVSNGPAASTSLEISPSHGGLSTASGASGSMIFRPPTEQLLSIPANVIPWKRSGTPLRLFTQAVPGGEAYRMRLARMLDSLDPQVVAIGGWTPSLGQESLGRPFLATFAALPEGNFRSVPADDAAASVVRVRQYRDDSGLYIYAVNTAPWRMRLQIATDATAGTEIRTLGDDPQTWTIGSRFTNVRQGTAPSGVSTTWAGELAPGELVAVHVKGPARGVAAWSGVPLAADRVAAELASQVEELSARVSILGRPRAYPALQNGGFEAGTEERIDGWLRAQHPPGCVRFENDAAEGRRAIVLRNDPRPGARTWLLSDPLQTPPTGRIAVSLRARSLTGPTRIRIAFEGRVRDTALRRSIEMDIPSGGPWPEQPLWLMVPDLPASDVEELRVAIDLISPGEIAIDDVQLYDFYLTDRERSELQRQMFVAVERMRRGDFTAAARLLDSHWAKYLRWLRMPLAVAGGSAPQNGESNQKKSNIRPEPPEEPTPGVASRLRQWLPEPLRF